MAEQPRRTPEYEEKLDRFSEKTEKGLEIVAGRVADTGAKMMHGVETIVKNCSPKEAACLAAATVGTVLYLASGGKKEKEEEAKKTPEPEEKKEEEARVPPTPAIEQKRKESSEKVEQLHSERHWRFEHPEKETVHVWHPDYKGDQLDEIVVYLHGGSNSADESWNSNKVGEQFRKSGRKALFIVPESQRKGQDIPWKNLDELIAYVKSQTGVNANKKVTIMGHSRAYATLSEWLKYEYVKEAILIDASYGSPDKFREWAKKEGKRLVIAVAKGESDTKKIAEEIVRNNADAKLYNSTPKFSEETRVAKLIYFTTKFGHTEMARNETDVIASALSLAGAPKPLPSDTGKDSESAKFAKGAEIELEANSRRMRFRPAPKVTDLLKTMNKNEPLVSVNGGIKLKETPAKAFEIARRTAQEMGYDIKLVSGYRTPEAQKKLYESASPEKRDKYVARDSWHCGGAAADCVLIDRSGKNLTEISTSKDTRNKYTDILEFCMNRAGYTNLSNESWHYEFGSKSHVEIMKKLGLIRPEVASADYTYKRDKLAG